MPVIYLPVLVHVRQRLPLLLGVSCKSPFETLFYFFIVVDFWFNSYCVLV